MNNHLNGLLGDYVESAASTGKPVLVTRGGWVLVGWSEIMLAPIRIPYTRLKWWLDELAAHRAQPITGERG